MSDNYFKKVCWLLMQTILKHKMCTAGARAENNRLSDATATGIKIKSYI